MDIDRTRTRGALTWKTYTFMSTNGFTCQLGENNHGGPVNITRVGTRETMVDSVTPGFRRKSKAGDVIVKPYWHFRETYTADGNHAASLSIAPSCSSPQTFNEERIDGPYALFASGFGDKFEPPALLLQSDIDKAVLVAASQAWSDANDHDASVLQDIAEWRQTASMLGTPTKMGSRLLNSFSKGSGRASKLLRLGTSGAEVANDLWLQWRFGVRPLVSTLDGVVKALGRLDARRRWTARGKYVLRDTRLQSGSTNAWNVGWNWSTTCTDVCTIRAGILLEEHTTLANNLGVDASGMLSLPWELVPFSFVADWFTNVGKFIEGLAPFLLKTPLASWWTVSKERTSRYQVGSSWNNSPSTYTLTRSPSGVFTGNTLEKQRFLALPGPSITFRPQSISNVLHDLRAIDSAALVFQKIGSILKG